MPHALRAAVVVCLLLSAPAAALTFGFSGTIQVLTDAEDFLDASVALGNAVTGTYEVDPTSPDESSPFGVGLAQLSIQLGNYLFTASQSNHTIALINDHVVATDPFLVMDDIWQPAEFHATELTPASNSSGDFAGYFALLQIFDFDSAVFDGSETDPIVPGDFSAPWEQVRLTLNSVDGALVYDNRVKVKVDITNWALVPEPRSAALLALGLASLGVRARKRVRAR